MTLGGGDIVTWMAYDLRIRIAMIEIVGVKMRYPTGRISQSIQTPH
jgi:hypothetical protein